MSQVSEVMNLDETLDAGLGEILDTKLQVAPEETTAEHPLMLVGGDAAVLGTADIFVQCKDGSGYQQSVVVYDLHNLVEVMHKQAHTDFASVCHDDCRGYDEALEFYRYNYMRYPSAKNAPIFVERRTATEINEAFGLEADPWQG
jgi:hypothetical protein